MKSQTEKVGDILRVGDKEIEPGMLYVLRSNINDNLYGRCELLHVISRYSGGEIRGYVRPEGEASFRLRPPAYPPEWPDLDAAVQALGIPVVTTQIRAT